MTVSIASHRQAIRTLLDHIATTEYRTDSRASVEFSIYCPKCGGGQHRDRSFSYKIEAGICRFICFRAKCGFKGSVVVRPSEVSYIPEPADVRQKNVGNPVDVPLGRPLDPEDLPEYLRDIYIPIREYGALWSNEKRRVMYPIKTFFGNVIAWSLRSYEQAKIKAFKLVVHQSHPLISWVRPELIFRDKPLIVVEDIPSAIRLGAAGWPACALIGTNLSDDKVTEIISRVGEEIPVLLAFDADAYEKSVELAIRHRNHGTFIPVYLSKGKDLKEESLEVIRSYFDRYLR